MYSFTETTSNTCCHCWLNQPDTQWSTKCTPVSRWGDRHGNCCVFLNLEWTHSLTQMSSVQLLESVVCRPSKGFTLVAGQNVVGHLHHNGKWHPGTSFECPAHFWCHPCSALSACEATFMAKWTEVKRLDKPPYVLISYVHWNHKGGHKRAQPITTVFEGVAW